MFLKKKEFSASSAPEFLIVGLGNPGEKYEYTRHNSGFLTLDRLCVEENFKINKIKFKSLMGEVKLGGHRCIVIKPQTFMNNSGEAVQAAMAYYKLSLEQLVVLSDDISLPVGGLRVRKKGSDGGQKGLRSIIACIGSEDFARVRIGIGAKPHPAYDLADWVLSHYKKDEQPLMDDAFERAAKAAEMIVAGDIDKAMNTFSH